MLVRVHASGVNPVDVAVRSGAYPLLGEPPFGVGWDISGVVEVAGPGARFKAGDEVFGLPFFPRAATGYAEYVAVPSRQVARKPAALNHVEAAALPLAALTAWQGLVDAAGLSEGQRVLIHRAAGGVGHLAVQIAKARGAYVIALASEPKHDFVRGLGADEVIDYRTEGFLAAVGQVDVVLDSSSQGTASLEVLREGGVLVSIMEHWNTALAAEVEAMRPPVHRHLGGAGLRLAGGDRQAGRRGPDPAAHRRDLPAGGGRQGARADRHRPHPGQDRPHRRLSRRVPVEHVPTGEAAWTS